MPKRVLKIDKFEGGKNTHLHKKDIPDNAFQEAENVMFDVVGRVRPGGFAKDLLSMGDASIDSIGMLAEDGYGLFSFSHDYTNPNTSTEISKISSVSVGGAAGDFSQTNNGSLGVSVHDGATNSGGVIKLRDASDSSIPGWKLWNDTPSAESGTGEIGGGWRYSPDVTNRLIYCQTVNTDANNYAVTAIGKAGRAYFVSVIGDGEVGDLTSASEDTNWASSSGGTGQIWMFAHKGVSLTNGGQLTELDDAGHTMTSAFVDIFVLGENTNGNIGLYANQYFEGRILKMNVYEVPSPKDISYILTQNHRYINLLDTSLTAWRTTLLPMHTSDLGAVKSGYYIANGNLRVFNADFGTVCENKWYGFVNRQNFLDTTVTTVDGSIAADSSTSGAYIRQWVEEDQRIYAPSATSHNQGEDPDAYTGDGNPGKATFADHGNASAFASASSDGIKIHIGMNDVTDATYDSDYKFYLSYLYDESEQESKLYQIGTDTDPSSGKALFIGVTVDYNNSNGYTFNKRVTGARLYYSDDNDTEGVKYHLLDIDFIKGCRRFDDVSFTAWNIETADSIVECPASLIGTTPSDGSAACFQFNQPPKVAFYESINGYAPDEDIYFRYKTAVAASDQLWIGNIGEVDSSGGVIKRFSDRILHSPEGRFDIFPMENLLDVAINDGDEIIKLESLADRLLVFKRKILYIVNIGKAGFEFIESEHKFIGVSHPSSVVKIEGGVAWSNNRGAFIYDGSNLVNLIDGKIDSQDWRNYTGVRPFIGYIPHRKQLLILQDAYVNIFYIYDFKTQSWSINRGGITAPLTSNLINVEDSTEVFNGNPIFSTKSSLVSTERIGVHQVSAPGTSITGFDLDSSVEPDALVVATGTPAVQAQGFLSVMVEGHELFTTVGAGYSLRFYLSNTAGTLAINSSTGNATTGSALTLAIPAIQINSLPGTGGGHNTVTSSDLAGFIAEMITNYQGTSGFSGFPFSNVVAITQVTGTASDNGKHIKWAHNGSGSWVVQASLSADGEFIGMDVGGGVAAVAHTSQVYIEGVDGATTNRYEFTVRPYDIDAWNAGTASFAPLAEGWAYITHTGGDTTSFSSGSDTTNQLIAEDLRALADENTKLRDDFGITVSEVAVAEVSTTVQTDSNANNIYFFSLTSNAPFSVTYTAVYLLETIRVFTNDNLADVGGYNLITKDFDFGYPAVNKKIYKIYVSFKCKNSFGNYKDSFIQVFYSTNGGDLLVRDNGTEFSTSKSKFYGSNGLTAFDSTGDLSTTLDEDITISPLEADIDVASASNITAGDAIKVDSEVMLVTSISSNTLTCQRGYMATTPATHSDGATVLIAKPNRDTTAELKPSSSINNVKSFQIKFQDVGQIPAEFEINDITIVYRLKNIK